MEKQLIARHFINNEGTLIEFSKQLKEILSANELLRKHNLNFGLKLTIDGKKVSDELKERIYQFNELCKYFCDVPGVCNRILHHNKNAYKFS